MKDEVTVQEAKVVYILASAWNEYLKLPKEHAMELDEFCRAIHICQDMILSRCGRRAITKDKSK